MQTAQSPELAGEMSWLLPLLVGSLLSLIATWLGEWRAERREARREDRELIRERARFAASVAAELDGLLRRYMQTAGNQLQAASNWQGFQGGYLPRFNYFAVFDANLDSIGLLDPGDATELVGIYIQAKGHMDNLITWGQMSQQPSSFDMGSFFEGLKRDHDQLNALVPRFLNRLRAYPAG